MRYHRIRTALRKDPSIHRISLVAAVLYGLVYYTSAGFILFQRQINFRLDISPRLLDMIWQSRGPFQWEAIGKVDVLWFGILIAVPNLLIALLLSSLVYCNLAMVLLGLRHPRICRLQKNKAGSKAFALLPALFTGFSCCAPTILILWVSIFGSVSSVMVLAMGWLLPLGLVLLTVTLITGYRNVLI